MAKYRLSYLSFNHFHRRKIFNESALRIRMKCVLMCLQVWISGSNPATFYTSILNTISKNTSCYISLQKHIPYKKRKKKRNGNSKQILMALGITMWKRFFKSSWLKIVNGIWCTTEQTSKHVSGDEMPLKWRELCNHFRDMILNYMAFQLYQQLSDFLLLLVPLEEM